MKWEWITEYGITAGLLLIICIYLYRFFTRLGVIFNDITKMIERQNDSIINHLDSYRSPCDTCPIRDSCRLHYDDCSLSDCEQPTGHCGIDGYSERSEADNYQPLFTDYFWAQEIGPEDKVSVGHNYCLRCNAPLLEFPPTRSYCDKCTEYLKSLKETQNDTDT